MFLWNIWEWVQSGETIGVDLLSLGTGNATKNKSVLLCIKFTQIQGTGEERGFQGQWSVHVAAVK